MITTLQNLIEADSYGKDDKEDLRAELALIDRIEADLKALKTARRELAVESGYAEMTTVERINTPNLTWWRKNKPRSWAKYCTTSSYKRFTWHK